MFKGFLRRVALRLLAGNADGDGRILALGNALMDECEAQGRSTEGYTDALHFLGLFWFSNETLEISAKADSWRVRGKRIA